jgi:hypothetical protein
MKYLISFIVIFISLHIFSVCSYAQQYEDVVYLKNGSIVHGTIMEQVVGESIKIKTNDGNLFIFKMDEIEKMTKEELVIKKDEIKKVDSIKTMNVNLKSDSNKTKVKELIAKNAFTIQPIGIFTLLTNIQYDRAISKNFSAGLKLSYMFFLIRGAISFTGNPSDVESADAMKKSLSAWGIGTNLKYYPGGRAIEGFSLGLAIEKLSVTGDEIKKGITTHHNIGLTRIEFEIGTLSKISSRQGGFTIMWSLGAGVGLGSDGDKSITIPLGSFGFGIGYSF